MSIEDTAPARELKCGDLKSGGVDLRCSLPEGHADGYEPDSGGEAYWHEGIVTDHREITYGGARHVVDTTETVTWEPVDHIAEATRHLMAAWRRDK